MRILFLLPCLLLIGCSTAEQIQPSSTLNDAGTITSVPTPSSSASASVPIDAGTDADTSSPPPATHCGDVGLPLCQLGEGCRSSGDCESQACDYTGHCIADRSCVELLGGQSCGPGEMGDPNAQHESCCKSLSVPNFQDPSHPGKTVYLDKYELTAGRMRAFVNAVIAEMGKPDFKGWVKLHRPEVWDDNWTQFLPSDYEGDSITISRFLLGDPRHLGESQSEAGPGVVLVSDTDQTVSTGLNHQFNGRVFTDEHGNNCGVYAGAYGFPTYWYPADVLASVGEVARPDPVDANGNTIKAQDALDVKSQNCTTNLMFQLFCSFDGGELATSEVWDYITATPQRSLDVSGCGLQYSSHADLLSNITTTSVFTGGRCADAYSGAVNLFFDAGQALPVPGSPLNTNFYHWPDYGNSTDDKSWIIAAPGRMSGDVVRINPTSNEGWQDLAGNLTETVLETVNGSFDGLFSLRGQGVGFGSERSDLNVLQIPLVVGIPPATFNDTADQGMIRAQRPEVKSGLVGARCMRFK